MCQYLKYKEEEYMKKLRMVLSLLMIGAMLPATTSISAQAAEVTTANDAATYSFYYGSKGIVKFDGFSLRDIPNMYGNAVVPLNKGDIVYYDSQNLYMGNGMFWYPCKYTDSENNVYYGYFPVRYVES